MTFLFPMILFVLVATTLFVLYTKPEVVPGHWVAQRPVSYTAVPSLPESSAADSGAAGSADGGTAEGGAAGTGDGA